MTGTIVIMIIFLVIIFTLLGILVFGRRNDKRWVAVGLGDVSMAISKDGKEWEEIEGIFGDEETGQGNDIFRQQEGRWVAVGNAEDSNNIWWSDDAEEWNGIDGPYGSGSVTSVYFYDGVWVVTGLDENSEGTIWWSYDAEEWTEVEEVAFQASGLVVKNIGGIWLAGGTMDGADGEIILRSVDGVDWEMVGFPTTGDDAYVNIFFQRSEGEIMLAGGHGGSGVNIWYSEDEGENWSNVTGDPFGSSGDVQEIRYLNKKFYAFGDNGSDKLIFSSSDGKSWTQETIPSSVVATSELKDVIIVDNEFYAVGQINDNGGYLFGTPSGNNIIWARGTSTDLAMVSSIQTIDKHRGGPFVVGTITPIDSEYSLIYSDTGNSGEWFGIDDNPFGFGSSVNKVLYA